MNLGPIKDKSSRRKGFRRLKAGYLLSALALCCVGVIGVTAAVTFLNMNDGKATTVVSPTEQSAAVNGSNVVIGQQEDTTDQDNAAQANAGTKAETVAMLLPVESNSILKGFSSDMLVYSATLKHWSTHMGIDFSAADGTPVLSALDGTVKSIENDPLMGNRITLTHSGGYTTVYASLGNIADGLEAGSTVLRGQKIGTVGTSAAAESEDGPHLHFEVLKDNVEINPQNYLSDLTK